jgi:methionine synthase I (cobalamin-dependent)
MPQTQRKPFIASTAVLDDLLKRRIVFLDGAMGSMIQRRKLVLGKTFICND